MVFFVLGAPSPSQNGARAWAGGRPNIVNVAATRAKTTLYVIGNRANWRTAGNFARAILSSARKVSLRSCLASAGLEISTNSEIKTDCRSDST